MRVVLLIAIASLLANAQCVADCAYHSCANSSTPRCHHKTPSSNRDDNQQPCSHQIIVPSQYGVSEQITTRSAPPVLDACTTIYVFLRWTAQDSPPEFQLPPPSNFPADSAVLRI